LKSRNSKVELRYGPEPIERPVCFALVEGMISPEALEAVESAVAPGARAAVELERFGYRHSQQPVV
jgi:hypothetical protein